jgi:nucleoside-diphosphate-sugar epimerase
MPIQRLYVDGLRNVLAALPPQTPRVIYISSTGVYAQHDGGWVDETALTEPTRDGGIASLAAEQVLAADVRGPNSIVLRIAGLYGPGRVPRRDDLLAGRAVADPGSGWLNLVHVEDAARVVVAAADATLTGIVNVSDGEPVLRCDYLREIARLQGGPVPHFSQPTQAVETSRSAGSKRVSNRRMIQQLRITLAYPDYRAGLAATLRDKPSEPTAPP